MINKVITDNEASAFAEMLAESNKVAITCHMAPDGDAVGSSLALYHLLTDLGKDVAVITPDAPPFSVSFLNGWNDIVIFSRYTEFGTKLLKEADLVICVDYNALYRIDRMQEAVASAPGKKVLIDHHLNPEQFCDLTISYPKMSSTCELLFRVICRMGLFNEISRSCAECIYTGMMTDTGNFSYNSNDANLYIIVAELMKKGINKDRIYQLAMNTSSEGRVRLLGYASSQKLEVYHEANAALITLTLDELARYDYKRGDTEGLVNVPLSIPDVVWSCYFREEKDYIKVSTRSKGDFAVNTICEEYFGGGGHRNAAGGEFHGTMEEAIAVFHKIINSKK